jgi:hypothetical protein
MWVQDIGLAAHLLTLGHVALDARDQEGPQVHEGRHAAVRAAERAQHLVQAAQKLISFT